MGLEEDGMSWSDLSERAPAFFGGAELELHHGSPSSTRQGADVGFVSRGFVSRGFVVPWLRCPRLRVPRRGSVYSRMCLPASGPRRPPIGPPPPAPTATHWPVEAS